jgi:hypothetical protein
MVEWEKPKEVTGFGLVYMSKCRRFFIDKRKGESNYQLCCTDKNWPKKPYNKLQEARLAAEKIASEMG